MAFLFFAVIFVLFSSFIDAAEVPPKVDSSDLFVFKEMLVQITIQGSLSLADSEVGSAGQGRIILIIGGSGEFLDGVLHELFSFENIESMVILPDKVCGDSAFLGHPSVMFVDTPRIPFLRNWYLIFCPRSSHAEFKCSRCVRL